MRYKSARFFTFVFFVAVAVGPSARAQAQPAEKPPILMLWARGEDLAAMKAGDRVSTWPDASGQGRDLKSIGVARPAFQADAVYGFPGVVLEKKPYAEMQKMLLPLKGEWNGATVFVVGRKLTNWGWFNSLPGNVANLRALSWIEVSGNKAPITNFFTDLKGSEKPEIATIRAGIDTNGMFTLDTFANGKQQGKATDPEAKYGVNWSPASSGVGSEFFEGAVAEILVYKGALSDAQRAQVERYLSAKYGVTADAAAPKTPVGFPVAANTAAAKVKPAPVTAKPVSKGLRFWLKADDLVAQPDNSRVEQVPNAVGGEPATTEGMHRPAVIQSGLHGRNILRFTADNQTPRAEVQWLKLPASLQGNWPEMTILVAGRHLYRAGIWDTAAGQAGTIRNNGVIQLTGSQEMVLGQPFPWLVFKDHSVVKELNSEGNIAALTLGNLGATGQYMATWADGQPQARKESLDKRAPLVFRNSYIGTTNLGEARFNGDIGEVLIYDRALTDAERAQSESYLAQKWAVPMRDAAAIERLKNARSQWSLHLPALPHTQSWFANTFSGTEKEGWVQAGMAGLTALPDGTVAAISIWDERHKEVGFYKDGKIVGNGLGQGGGQIANDGKYVYAAVSGYENLFTGVRRLNLDGTPAPWPDLPVVEIQKNYPSKGAIRFAVPQKWNEVRGLAIGNGELYVTAQGLDEIRVYDADTGAFKRAIPQAAPGYLAVDKTGRLWAALADKVICFAADGTPADTKIEGVVPGGLAVDPAGLLWLAENGVRQQLIGYDVSGAQPVEKKAIGEKGGVYAGPRPGQLTDKRIMPPKGLAIDGAGNFYVLSTNVLRCYSPQGAVKWTIECTSFTTCSDFDPSSDGNVIYTGRERYDYVPGAPPGKDWKLSGFTADAHRFPEISAGSSQTVLRKINGQLLRYSPGSPMLIHRQEANSDIFAPAGVYEAIDYGRDLRSNGAPAKGRYIWSDLNGNGLRDADEYTVPKADAPPNQLSYSTWVDSEGSLWEPEDRLGMRVTPLKSMTTKGVPVYDLANQVWYPKPKEFMQVMRCMYLPRTDTMLLTGTTWENPTVVAEWWGSAGREVICYSDWKKPTRKILWRAAFPEEAVSLKAVTVAPAANLFFVGCMETTTIFAYDLRTGKFIGLVEPDRKLVGDVGWIDIDAGIRAFTRSNGEVLLLCEEVWSEKQMVYRIQARK